MSSPFASSLHRGHELLPYPVDSTPLPRSSVCHFLAVSCLPQMLLPVCPILPLVLLEALSFHLLRPRGLSVSADRANEIPVFLTITPAWSRSAHGITYGHMCIYLCPSQSEDRKVRVHSGLVHHCT